MNLFVLCVVAILSSPKLAFGLVTKISKDLQRDNTVYLVNKLTIYTVSEKFCSFMCKKSIVDEKINLRKINFVTKKCECFHVLDDSTDVWEIAPEIQDAVFLMDGKYTPFYLVNTLIVTYTQ